VGDFFRRFVVSPNIEQIGVDPSTPVGDVFPRKAAEEALAEAEKEAKINHDRAPIESRLSCEQAKKDAEAKVGEIAWNMLLAWKRKRKLYPQLLEALRSLEGVEYADLPAGQKRLLDESELEQMLFADIEASFKDTPKARLSEMPGDQAYKLFIPLAVKWSFIVDLEWLAGKLDQWLKQQGAPEVVSAAWMRKTSRKHQK
jgi:hypothetical protein